MNHWVSTFPQYLFASQSFWFSLSVCCGVLALLNPRYRAVWFMTSAMIVFHGVGYASPETRSLPLILGALTPFYWVYAAQQGWLYYQRKTDKTSGPKTDLINEIETLSNVFRQLPIGCIVLSRDCKIIEVNEVLSETFGYVPSELVGQHVNIMLPEEFHEGHEGKVQALIEGRIEPTGWRNVTGQHKSGRAIKIKLSVKPLKRSVFNSAPALGIGMTELR